MQTWFVYMDEMDESVVHVVTERLDAKNRYTHFKGSS
jgi:hypothetical protein